MNRLRSIIAQAQQSRDVQLVHYSSFPSQVAELCTEREIPDLIAELQTLAQEWNAYAEEHPEDGDGQDDIWRDQKRFAEVLRDLLPRFPEPVFLGLRSAESRVRFWTAWAIQESPSPLATPALQAAIERESDELNLKVLRNALARCTKPWWKFWS